MNMTLLSLWTWLAASPLFWLTLTLSAYQLGNRVFKKSGCNPLLNPVMTSVFILVIVLKISGTEYKTYFSGAQFIHFMLGPATVALAIPLYREIQVIRQTLFPVAITVTVGSLAAIVSAVGIAWCLGGNRTVLLTLSPKSVTTPIAMGISEKIGGLPSLTAVAVVLTGITGAVTGGLVLNVLRIHDMKARGMALGLAAHGIGTAYAMQQSPVSGAFSAMAMALNGLLTAILLPVIISLLY